MITFWILAGGLVLLVMAILAVPLLRGEAAASDAARQREQNIAIARERLAELRKAHEAGELDDAAFEEARAELEIELLEDAGEEEDATRREVARGGRWILAIVALVLPALSIGLYYRLGSPEAVTGEMQPPPAATNSQHSLEEMVARLADRMRAQPDDPRGWLLLGRSYMTLGRYPQAVEAFRRARALVGDEPAVLVPLADALAMTNGGQLAGEPVKLLETAREKDPEDPTTLWLLGMAWLQQGQPEKALEHWYALRPRLTDDPENAAQLDRLIERAESQLEAAGKPLPKPLTMQTASKAPDADNGSRDSAGAAIRVHVELDPSLAAEVSPDDTLFVYARALKGPPMPLAVARMKAGKLPADVTLDDSMAMMPAMRLSRFDAVRIEARISKSGNAISQPGDLVGRVEPVGPGARVTVRIDHRVE